MITAMPCSVHASELTVRVAPIGELEYLCLECWFFSPADHNYDHQFAIMDRHLTDRGM